MNAVLRRLLAVLVALVIPLQGFASVADLRCAPADVHAASHAAPSPHAGHAHDGHPAPAATGHHHDGDGGHDHCGPCAACCAAAFISGPAPSLPFPAARSEAVAFVAPPAHAINPEPLDRPPLPL